MTSVNQVPVIMAASVLTRRMDGSVIVGGATLALIAQ